MAENQINPMSVVPKGSDKDRAEVQEVLPPSKMHHSPVVAKFHSGPLPDPEALDRYNLTLPGAAERIVAMAEAEQSARLAIAERESLMNAQLAEREMSLQEVEVKSRLRWQGVGLTLAFFTTILIVGAALIVAVYAPNTLTAVGSLVTGIVWTVAHLYSVFADDRAKTRLDENSVKVPTEKKKPSATSRRRSK